MKRLFSLSAFGALMLTITGATAQQTGSFTEQITFNNESRNLSIYVPPTYDATLPCRLVVGLHGMGDNSNNYRNALVNSLAFAAAFPNTILVCPDGGSDFGRSFHEPMGDEAIIEESMAFIKNTYSIDTAQIILQGFSLGGYSALRYGLAHPQQFRGLLLNTPAIQGVKEANNQSQSVTIPYNAVGDLPVFITIGSQDDIYIAPIDSAAVKLVEEDARLAYRSFNGGHTVPPFTNYDYLSFFNNPYSAGADVRIAKIDLPFRSCDATVIPRVLVQNKGTDPVTSLKFSYGVGTMVNQEWQGNLPQGGHAYIPLQSFTFPAEGNPNFQVKIDSVNHLADIALFDNVSTRAIQIQSNTSTMPYATAFDTEDFWNKWVSVPSGDYLLPWEYDDDADALFSFNSIFVFDNAGTREEVKTPEFNLSGATQAYLHFTTDYNYVQYSAAVFGLDTVFADTLEVMVSTDCGATYATIFQEGGSQLSGHDGPLQDPLNLQALFIAHDPTKNVAHTVDVSSFANMPQVHFKFSYRSQLGGYIYLDNVSLTNSMTDVKMLFIEDLRVYPNPVKDVVHIASSTGESLDQVVIYDILGKQIGAQQAYGKSSMQVNTSQLPNGVYNLNIISKGGSLNKKIVVQH